MAAQFEPVAIFGADAVVHGMASTLLRAGIRTNVCGRDSASAPSLWNRGATVTTTVGS
jgi:3-hydroxyisobutyrate dehydrogenase-like beta-hydroxyacid dehydrogenase